MYVCLCKALKEADVGLAARECMERFGSVEVEDVIEVLGLHSEETCGFCVDHPETIAAIAQDEAEAAAGEIYRTEPAIS
jgi:bacterioferritin-associated ferredoxin